MFATVVRDNLYGTGFTLLASPARYTPSGAGTGIATRAKIDRGMVAMGDFGQTSQPTILLSLPRADVPQPRAGATVVVEGEGTFVVERRQSDNGYKVIVTAREVEA